MSKPAIFWDPTGLELDSLGSKSCLRSTDGDTPYVSPSSRMLSIEASEPRYPGNSKPSRSHEKVAEHADWFEDGSTPIDPEPGVVLKPKLETGDAGTLHGEQGEASRDFFQQFTNEKLAKSSGQKRRVYLKSGDEQFDRYNRVFVWKKDVNDAVGQLNLLLEA